MTVANWPAELPRPSRKDYSAQLIDNRLKKRSRGVPGHRRATSLAGETVTLSIFVTRSLRAVFEEFYRTETGGGTLPFYMPDPTTDGWPLLADDGAPLLQPDGTPILLSATWLCLWGDATPLVKVRGVRFDINFSVTVMP